MFASIWVASGREGGREGRREGGRERGRGGERERERDRGTGRERELTEQVEHLLVLDAQVFKYEMFKRSNCQVFQRSNGKCSNYQMLNAQC